MTVHVDEIHTQITAGAGASEPGTGTPASRADGATPGVPDDLWRGAEARVHRLRCRVAAEGFDD